MQLSCSGLMVMRAAMRLGHTTADGLMFLRAEGMPTPPSTSNHTLAERS